MQPLDGIQEYSRCVCDQIRWKKAHSLISEEVENHLVDQRDANIADGMDEISATHQAILQMGDPVMIGTQLDRTHRPRPQWGMILVAMSLVIVGLIIRMFVTYEGNIWRMLTQLISSAVGLGLMAVAYFSDFTLIGKYPKTIYFSIMALSVAALSISPIINGRPYYAGFMPLLFPLGFVAIVYIVRNKGYWGIILCGIAFLLPACFALFVPAVSGFLLFTVSELFIITIAISKNWFGVKKLHGYLLIFIPTAAAIFLAGGMFVGRYGLKRLQVALNPSIDPAGGGYQSIVVRNLLNASKLFGTGDMPAVYKSLRFPLPEIDTNYILTYLIFKLGWIAFIIIMSVLLFFIIKGFMQCFRQKSSLGLFVSVSIMLTFTLQVIGYVITNLGFQIAAPICLPLLSYGKIATSINLFLIGIMLSVFRTGDIVKDKYQDRIRKDNFITWSDGKLIISFGRK
jgi:cell division protein FtsW (lipid II flippase)